MMAAVRRVRECRPFLWTGLGVLLHQVGWPADKPTSLQRANDCMAGAGPARRINQANDDPLLQRARLAADHIFNLLGRAIYDGAVLAAVEGQEIADWVELGSGRVIRADTAISPKISIILESI